MEEFKNGRHHPGLPEQMQFLLVSRLHILQQFTSIQLHIVVVPVLHLNLLFKVNCQFHYFLLTRTTHLFDSDTLLVMRGSHVVEFLFQLAVFELVLLFFEGFLVGDNAVLGGELG